MPDNLALRDIKSNSVISEAAHNQTKMPKKSQTELNNSIIEYTLRQLNLWNGEWTDLDTIDAACGVVLSNEKLIHSLPKRVRGNLEFLSSDIDLYRRKALMGLARRMAKELGASIVCKRKQLRVDGKTVSKYSYKLLRF